MTLKNENQRSHDGNWVEIYSETLEFNAYKIEIETKSIESKRTESNRIEKFPYA